jgi:hypothetical protein
MFNGLTGRGILCISSIIPSTLEHQQNTRELNSKIIGNWAFVRIGVKDKNAGYKIISSLI